MAIAAATYIQQKGLALNVAIPVALAFLVELPFYMMAAFDAPRQWIEQGGKTRAAAIITASTALPWLIYTLPTGKFSLPGLALIVILGAAVAFWYIMWDANAAADAGFLVIPAAAIIFNVFRLLYPTPLGKLDISILGHVMLIRTAALAVLTVRGNAGVEFRFIPTRTEWTSGVRWFATLIVPVVLLYWALGLIRVRPHPLNIGLAGGTFIGILWVVALSEEFFFRGLLLPWISKWTRSETVGLVVSSIVFGAVHLGFQHKWPNWRFATVAALAGFFYGLAWRSTRSIQSSMVTHALTVTLWRVFLQ